MMHPMRNFQSIQEIEEYPFPDMTADYRWEGLKEKNQELIDQGLRYRGVYGDDHF